MEQKALLDVFVGVGEETDDCESKSVLIDKLCILSCSCVACFVGRHD